MFFPLSALLCEAERGTFLREGFGLLKIEVYFLCNRIKARRDDF